MLEYIAYWTDKAEKGIDIVFGPVSDPTDKSGIQKTEFYLMRAVLPKWW